LKNGENEKSYVRVGASTLDALKLLGMVYWQWADYDSCLKISEDILEIRRRKLDPEDPTTLGSMNQVAVNWIILGPANAQRIIRDKK
jgi:hypothetical protein